MKVVHIDEQELKQFKRNALVFYVELACQIRKGFPFKNFFVVSAVSGEINQLENNINDIKTSQH